MVTPNDPTLVVSSKPKLEKTSEHAQSSICRLIYFVFFF